MIAGTFLLIAISLILYKLDARLLQDWDEGTYANIAGAMAKSGDYWHLTLYGKPWYEKEPLPFWLIASSIKIFGFNVWALRFPLAALSVFIFPLFYVLSRRFLRRTEAILSTTLLVVSPVVWHNHFLRTADFDMSAVVLILGALVIYLYKREQAWWLSGILLAGLCLVRGVWGFLFLGMIVILELCQTPKWPWKKFFGLILITTGPWLLWHWWSFSAGGSDYVQVYWQKQFFFRITDPLQGHAGRVDFYWNFLRILLGRPFLWLLIVAILLAIVRYIKKRSADNLFLPLWLLISLLPPHLISTKVNWYIASALPAMYLAFGGWLAVVKDILWFSTFKYKAVVWGLLLALLSLATVNFTRTSLVKVANYDNEKLSDKNPEWSAAIWYRTYDDTVKP